LGKTSAKGEEAPEIEETLVKKKARNGRLKKTKRQRVRGKVKRGAPGTGVKKTKKIGGRKKGQGLNRGSRPSEIFQKIGFQGNGRLGRVQEGKSETKKGVVNAIRKGSKKRVGPREQKKTAKRNRNKEKRKRG